MSLKLEIYLPNEFTDNLEPVENLITEIGDLLAQHYGNDILEEEFNLNKLNSFIVITDSEIPVAENFINQDMYLVIPIEGEK